MTPTTTVTRALSADMAKSMMKMGSDLPGFIAQMDTIQRFAVVGALYAEGYILNQALATALLFDPENVLLIPSEVFEQGRQQIIDETTEAFESAGIDQGGNIPEAINALFNASETTPESLARELSETGSMEYPVQDDQQLADWEQWDQLTEAEQNDAIYNIAEAIVLTDPAYGPLVEYTLDMVGLPWPRPASETELVHEDPATQRL